MTLADGDVLTIDAAGGLLISMREGSWPLVSVDECQAGSAIALTVRDSNGTSTPRFGAEVTSIRSL